MQWKMRVLALGVLTAAVTTVLSAGVHDASAAVQPTPSAAIAAAQDTARRMTIPVMINGAGPFAFVVDTGADRTVISRDLASKLGLPPGRIVRLHDTAGSAEVPTAVVDTLAFGGREIHGVQAPLLRAADLGADGMLGIDALRGEAVTMDFRAGTFSVGPSDTASVRLAANTIVVLGKRRFGQLVLVDAEAEGDPVLVILDTGAQNSLGNGALRTMLQGVREKRRSDGDVISVMGQHTAADLNRIETIRLGGINLTNVPIAYADLQTFEEWGLSHRPAILLGMDVLRLFRSVSVDFLRREATFVPQ